MGPTTAVDRISRTSFLDDRALARCHEKSIVHRDIKPDNILIDQKGQPKIADFGLAVDTETLVSRRSRITARSGMNETDSLGPIVGTPAYMAPELYVEPIARPASDQFAIMVFTL